RRHARWPRSRGSGRLRIRRGGFARGRFLLARVGFFPRAGFLLARRSLFLARFLFRFFLFCRRLFLPVSFAFRRRGLLLGALGVRQRFGVAIPGDARVLVAVGDVGSPAALEHLDAVAKVVDDPVAKILELGLDQLFGARQLDGVGA